MVFGVCDSFRVKKRHGECNERVRVNAKTRVREYERENGSFRVTFAIAMTPNPRSKRREDD